MIYAAPGQANAKINFKAKYDNFIGGKWVAPVKGEYFDVITPISGKNYTKTRPFDRRGHRTGARRRSRRRRQMGPYAGRPSAPTSC